MANLSGKEIGNYRITERIGRGGMAEVYLGVHKHLDRQVAIKVLHGHLLDGGDFLTRFKREAKAVANLRHPDIIQVHDFDIQDETIFMVMDFIDGSNLQERLVALDKKGERLSIKQIGSIISDVGGALDYASGQEHPLRAELWCIRAEAALAVDQVDEAILSFENCIEWTDGDPGLEGLRVGAAQMIEELSSGAP